MGWKDLGISERWALVTSSLQAVAAIGTFLVALIGIWKVTPIITYQVERQEAKAELAASLQGNGVVKSFVEEVQNWWIGQVRSYDRIVELTEKHAQQGWKVGFQILDQGGIAVVPGMTPDLLVVTAISPAGKSEEVRVPVNDKAMTLAQYIQCKINQGALSGLEAAQQERAEIAVQSYLHRYMLPRVPQAFVRSDMSIKELHDEIVLHQSRREDAIKQIRAMLEVINAALEDA